MDVNASFVPAVELSRSLAEVLKPRLRGLLPGVPLALAVFGAGSDVQGYDSARSTDHDWGPRLNIVVPNAHLSEAKRVVDARRDELIPTSVKSFPARFSSHPDGSFYGDPAGEIHRVEVSSVQEILQQYLQEDSPADISTAVWLSTPMQSLLEITGGEVFLDEAGELSQLRSQLVFYPEDIWRYQLSALWMRVAQMQPSIGRTYEAGDDVGSAVIVAGIARDLMRIALLQSSQYAPYAKWLGTATSRVKVGEEVLCHLRTALQSPGFSDRESGINVAGTVLIRQLNELRLIGPKRTLPSRFHSRPYLVMPSEEIAHALHESLVATECERLPAFVGGIDMVTDSTDAMKSIAFRRQFSEFLREA